MWVHANLQNKESFVFAHKVFVSWILFICRVEQRRILIKISFKIKGYSHNYLGVVLERIDSILEVLSP